MPRSRGHEVKVGIFVAIGLSILGLFVVVLTGIGLRGGDDEYRVTFANVAGLENGSVVALGGLKVGRVESVGISQDDLGMVEAVIRVKKGTPIRRNSKAEVTSVGITGSMFLSISLGTPDSPLLKPGSRIRGVEAASFQEVTNQVREAADRINNILGGLAETVDSISADARALIMEIRVQAKKTLVASDRVLLRVERILSDRNERNINRFLESLARAADLLDEASSFVAELKGRLTTVDRVLARVESLTEGLEKMVASGDVAINKLSKVLEVEIRGVRQDLQKELATTAHSLLGEIASVGGQARTTLKEGGQSLATALGAVERVFKQAEDFFEANRKELSAGIVNFRSVSKQIDDILSELSAGQNGDELQSTAEDLRHALQRARSLMSHLDETIASHREDIHLLIMDLRDTGENLNEFTTTLRERPSTVIFKPPARPREFEE